VAIHRSSAQIIAQSDGEVAHEAAEVLDDLADSDDDDIAEAVQEALAMADGPSADDDEDDEDDAPVP